MSDETLIELVEFDNEVPGDEDNLRQLQNVYSNNVQEAWEKEGFCNIKPLDKPAHGGDLCPAYRAERGGSPCLILMPPPAPNPMELDGLGDAQCERVEKEFPECDVYYSSVLLWSTSLMLYLPVKVRGNGEWLTDEAETEQFIPPSRREGGSNLLPAILGCGYMFKAIQYLIPGMIRIGAPPPFRIRNLFDAGKPEGTYYAMACSRTPCWMLIIHRDDETKTLNASHAALYHDAGPYTELELVDMDEEYREYGLVQLLHPSGRELYTECVEATVFAESMPKGRRYMWSLYMVAEHAAPASREIVIKEGPLYDMQREKYREENGEEPPADFSVTLSTAGMRAVNQTDDGEDAAYAGCFGVIDELGEQKFAPEEIPGGKCLKAVVRCMPDDDDFLLTLYLPPAALGGYEPKVGDTISFAGTLCAAADELCATEESWQDSAEVGKLQGQEENRMAAFRAMDLYKESSIGLGVAASAFVQAGWNIEPGVDPNQFSRNAIHLPVRNQRGQLAVILVDTVVDGHEPKNSYTETRKTIESFVQRHDAIDFCHFCRVHLDCKPESDRYAVSMEIDPECPGVENHLLLTGSGFPGTESYLEKGKRHERRTRPEKLDEAMAAELFQNAMAKGEWAALAKWMREEMTYRSHTAGVEFYGKMDFLRHMAERIEGWKRAGMWKDFAFSRGTVTYQGRERACVGTYHRGALSNTTIFGDKLGMVGHMETLPREYCELYHEETPPVAPDET